jgi:probable rRNA maturation factor
MNSRPALTVSVVNAHRFRKVRAAPVRKAVRAVLRGERVRRAEVTVVVLDARRSRKMNRQFLGHDYSTDVISFLLERRPRLEGEIYLNIDRAREQAREYGVSIANEIDRLMVHGTLHLLGYDDTTVRDAGRMVKRQEEYVHRLQKGR